MAFQSVPAEQERKTVLIHSPSLLQAFNTHPKYKHRGDLVLSLISAYGLDNKLQIIAPQKIEWKDLQTFHSQAFIDFIRTYGNIDADELSPAQLEEADMYGLNYDCPLFEGIPGFVLGAASSSLTAAEAVMRSGGMAINWYGGWHHGHRDEASGFCYVNDIVLCLLKLLDHYQTVLYVDVDIHHGDGVEEAFYYSSRVMTISFHKCAPGFFPGTGRVARVGSGPGKFFTVNVPLKDGLTDNTFTKVFTRVLSEARNCFQPSAVVLQCGADMLSGDPVGTFSLTPHGLSQSIAYVLDWKLPTVLLGGGGYNFTNTAKFWTICTGLTIGQKLSDEIPEHCHLECYSPDFDLSVTPRNRPDENTNEYIAELLEIISSNVSNISN